MGRTVLIVGDNGGAHALGLALARAPSIERVDAAGFNVGLSRLGRCHPVDTSDFASVADLAESIRADLVIPMSSIHLANGIADTLADRGLRVFGPTRDGAQLEGSKRFTKDVALEAGIPTPHAKWSPDPESARASLDAFRPPYVIKSSGHAKPRGVCVCADLDEAHEALDEIQGFRNAGMSDTGILVESFVQGPEVSLIGVASGTDFRRLGCARDHKRLRDGNAGPNTGGMGAFSPVPDLAPSDIDGFEERIARPLLEAIAARGIHYVGFLYLGLIRGDDDWQLLEVNVRLGDPEAQVVLPGVSSDLGELLERALRRSLSGYAPDLSSRSHCCVTIATGDYPYGKRLPAAHVHGVDRAVENGAATVVFGRCALDAGQVVTTYGRALHVVGHGATVPSARSAAYEAVAALDFDGMQYRKDIASGAGA